MNSFYEHHKDSIRLHYRCFDRILLNGLIQPFQQPKRVVGFFDTYRRLYPVSRQTLTGIADRFQQWLKAWSEKRNVPILEAPKGRRDEFVEPYFKGAKPDEVVAVVKAREPARIMIAIGDKAANRWHLQFAQRWVVQYNFYVNDQRWGRMFVRICPICRSQRGSTSISITGWQTGCAKRASTSSNAPTLSSSAPGPTACRNLPINSRRVIW
jgi:hypothetical protein